MAGLLEEQRQTRDLLHQVVQHQGISPIAVERAPTLYRLEDLMLRLLVREGDSEAAAERGIFMEGTPRARSQRKYGMINSDVDEEASSADEDDRSLRSYETATRFPRPPAPSALSVSELDEEHRVSRLPTSLRSLTPGQPSIDESWEMHNMPPLFPDVGEGVSRGQPPHIPGLERRRPLSPPDEIMYRNEQPYPDDVDERSPSPELEQEQESESEAPLSPREVAPTPRSRSVPPPLPRVYRSPSSSSSDDTIGDRRMYPGPLPQPLGLPSPVTMNPPIRPNYRPPFRPGFIPSMPYPPTMPRMSLPHLAQNREPMTTTYFRRGIPMGLPGNGPMGPVSRRAVGLIFV